MQVLSFQFLHFARILPEFLLKIRPDSAQIFTKIIPDEELLTLVLDSNFFLLQIGCLLAEADT